MPPDWKRVKEELLHVVIFQRKAHTVAQDEPQSETDDAALKQIAEALSADKTSDPATE